VSKKNLTKYEITKSTVKYFLFKVLLRNYFFDRNFLSVCLINFSPSRFSTLEKSVASHRVDGLSTLSANYSIKLEKIVYIDNGIVIPKSFERIIVPVTHIRSIYCCSIYLLFNFIQNCIMLQFI
jgi:hypothetical protein